MRICAPSLPFVVALSALASCAPEAAQPPAIAPPKPVSYTPAAGIPGSPGVVFKLPRAARGDFFDLPWPTDLAKTAAGKLDLANYPGRKASIFAEYVRTAQTDLDGYSLAPVVYFRFQVPSDASRGEVAARTTLSPQSPVFLVDVDPASPDRGRFVPLAGRASKQGMRFIPEGTLAVKPVEGFVLRPGTLYAAVVRRDFGVPDGPALATSDDLEFVKWTAPRQDPLEERARQLHAPAFEVLARLGVARADVGAIAVFRTQVAHVVTERLLALAAELAPPNAPHVISLAWDPKRSVAEGPGAYDVVIGTYCTPNAQRDLDRAPFLDKPGGRIGVDAEGRPAFAPVAQSSPAYAAPCAGMLRARFALSVPRKPMPPEGFPLVVSSHGTGGNALTFLGERNIAGWAASAGAAVVSTDQPLHGGDEAETARPGSREPVVIRVAGFPLRLGTPELASEVGFYNPFHPAAARDNLRQAALDGFVLAHLFAGLDLGKAGLGADAQHPAARLDAHRVILAGHSQGSQSAIVQGALDPIVRGVLLSGCGGDARLGVVRRRQLPIVPLATTMIGLAPGELDEFHPLMALFQTLADPIDPATYARFYYEPLPGRTPPRLLHLEGITDTFNPPETAELLAVALRATQVGGALRPVAAFDLLSAPRNARVAFAQFASTHGENGHFVLFREAPAQALAIEFFQKAGLE